MTRATKVLLDLSINDDVGGRVATSARHTELLESAKSQHQKSSMAYVETLEVVRPGRLTLLLPILFAHATALALDLGLHGCEGGSELLEVVEGADPASLDLGLGEDDGLVCAVPQLSHALTSLAVRGLDQPLEDVDGTTKVCGDLSGNHRVSVVTT
jgi:hypothetical protein